MKLRNITLIIILSEVVLLLILYWISLTFVTIRQDVLLFIMASLLIFNMAIMQRREKNIITRHEKVEEHIKKSEEKYRSFLESTEDSIYMVDCNGNYQYMNPKHLARLGIGNFCGRGYRDCHQASKTDVFMESVRRVYETGKTEQYEHEYRGKWFIRSLSPIKDPLTKSVTSVIVISTDITVRKKAEGIHNENERLAFANKAKSEFLANMSHELRTPLNSIIGFTELLGKKIAGDLNVKQERYVENVLNSSKFLLNLINDILDLSKVEAGKIELIIEKISLPIVIGETITLLKERASKNKVVLKKELDTDLDIIEADKQRIKQILFNLLNNAIKFSKPEGGTVCVRTKMDGATAKISVSDTGIGIRGEDLGKLFREFEQVNPDITRNYGGTGLGLAISKKLVELHGGRIWVESRFGEGSTFTFELPVARVGHADGSELILIERQP
jgi:PAS domain S-box-containing protein